MSQLRKWICTLTLACVVIAVSSLLSGCCTPKSGPGTGPDTGPATVPTAVPIPAMKAPEGDPEGMLYRRPTLYEVRRGPMNIMLVAVYTENAAGGSGQIVFAPDMMPINMETDQVTVAMEQVPEGYNLCVSYSSYLLRPMHDTWHGDLNLREAPVECD